MAVDTLSGIRFVREDADAFVFEIHPGSWQIQARLLPSPARFGEVDIQLDGDVGVLSWQTLQEIDNIGFEIHKQINDDFQQIGFVDGAGTRDTPNAYNFTLPGLSTGRHAFRIKAVSIEGSVAWSPEVEVDIPYAGEYALHPAYPNPFTDRTTLSFTVREPQHVRIDVFDVLGRRLAVLFDARVEADVQYQATLSGTSLPSGIYLYRIVGERFTELKTVTLTH
jgi:hypothetical protein